MAISFQIFDAAGNYLRKIGSEGDRDGQLKFPRGVTTDQDGEYQYIWLPGGVLPICGICVCATWQVIPLKPCLVYIFSMCKKSS